MSHKHYLVRHRGTHEVVDRNCHDVLEHRAIEKAWGARYELLEVPAEFDVAEHYMDAFGAMQPRARLDPVFSRKSGTVGDKITVSNLPPGAKLKVNSAVLEADSIGKITFESRAGDDFIEGVGFVAGATVLPDKAEVARRKTTNKKYMAKNERAQAFLAGRPGARA